MRYGNYTYYWIQVLFFETFRFSNVLQWFHFYHFCFIICIIPITHFVYFLENLYFLCLWIFCIYIYTYRGTVILSYLYIKYHLVCRAIIISAAWVAKELRWSSAHWGRGSLLFNSTTQFIPKSPPRCVRKGVRRASGCGVDAQLTAPIEPSSWIEETIGYTKN